jgi:putative colanic acid biosynthesis acetyltransferase WcaF
VKVDLARYDNRGYHPGAGVPHRALWYLVNALFFQSWLHLGSGFKCRLLRLFGARIGRGVVIKPRVNVKYPWHLEIGDHVWIGEGTWLDSLDRIVIADNVCISQEAYLLTGSHDYTDPSFGLIVKPITIEEGAWIGARAVVCPGVKVGRCAVVGAGSVLTGDATPSEIYVGNPACSVRSRKIREMPDGCDHA